MGKFILAFLLILSGCTTHNELGSCVGVGEKQNPDLEYKLSAWNLGVGIIFIELIVPPIIVAVDAAFCPVAKKVKS